MVLSDSLQDYSTRRALDGGSEHLTSVREQYILMIPILNDASKYSLTACTDDHNGNDEVDPLMCTEFSCQ